MDHYDENILKKNNAVENYGQDLMPVMNDPDDKSVALR